MDIEVDPKKTDAVKNLLIPFTPADIRSFLGLAFTIEYLSMDFCLWLLL